MRLLINKESKELLKRIVELKRRMPKLTQKITKTFKWTREDKPKNY